MPNDKERKLGPIKSLAKVRSQCEPLSVKLSRATSIAAHELPYILDRSFAHARSDPSEDRKEVARKHSVAGQVFKDRSKTHSTVEAVGRHLSRTRSLLRKTSLQFSQHRVVPEDEDGYPEVRPSSKQKSDVFVAKDHVRVDEHAMSAPDSLQDDFDSLVEYLVQDLTATVSMVRSIYIWVTTQRLPMTSSVGFTQTDTPRGFLFNIREKKATYQELFAVLCRRSHIPCVIVHGVAKSICYDAGAKVSFKKGKNSWNAVLIDGEWRLVHPYWGASSAPGYCTGRWGEVGSSSERDANDNAQSRFALSRIRNEFYFLTDPDMFITKCFPENPSWQLLSKPLSKIEFEDLPFYQPAFYELKLKERLHENCVVHTSDGECNFEFTLPVDRAQRYKLSYTLHARRALDAEGEYDVTPLEGYSFRYRYEHTEYLQFRFPYIGVFKLNVFCKDSKCSLPSDWVVEYKIVCSKTNPNCRPYPITPAIGWGPNAELDAVGMHSFSHKNALVSLDEEPVTFVRFALPRDQEIDIEADLVTNGMSRDEMKSHVTLETEGGYAVIKVAPPGEGEYALQVFVNDGSERKNVCNYLMRRTKLVEDPELADIRSQLQRAVESGDAEALAHWISKFSERDMEDRGDLALSRKKLHFAKLNRDLEEAIARKDLDLLEKALQSASGTSLRRQLGDLAVRAEAMRSRLRRFKRLRHEVLAMNQKTISEIRSYPKPPDAVHAVMAASFLLLGNQEQELRKWSKIQSLISKRGKDSLKRRVADFKTDSVQPEVLKRVNEILAKYDLETVQVASVGAATFFQWAFTMAAEMDEKDL
ncbi:lim and transglutaminase domain protein ltd-1-like isoform X2 [Dreissena polymorpha]|uniref:lim and transglutaminase domain protein ltd-1-like isoform X2 n=1 Tax=Dreissena polymorpha TaxID=45954 RepID=UPI0022642975|nr:lim and transglutaminase domain protein ltd-1-like isoform X2 [Dreissena polymorpha]